MSDQSTSPLDAQLYPDLVEAGGLGPALLSAARRAGVDLEELTWPAGFFALREALVETPRGEVSYHLTADERRFGVEIFVEDKERAWGGTDDLEQAAWVGAAWRDGSNTRELIAAYPFMKTDRFAQAREDGDLLEVLWDYYLHDEGYETIRPVLRAAYDDPRLRRLHPSVSHGTLARFTVDPRDRANGQVAIRHHPGGHYEVETSWQQVSRSAATPAEAVRLAAAEVPDSGGTSTSR